MFTTLSTATTFLEQRRRIDVEQAKTFLRHTMYIVQAARVMAELAPARYAEITQDGLRVRELAGDGIHPLQNAALELANELFPLAWHVEENLLDSGELYLDIESQGFPYNWDRWGECIEDPDEFGDNEELFVLVQCLGGKADLDYLEAIAARFKWQFDLQKVVFDGDNSDTEKLFKKLRRAGLEEFITVFQIGWYQTGNIFFDYIMDDEMGFCYTDFTVVNILELKAQFADSVRISSIYSQALARVWSDPDVLKKVVKIYQRSQRKKPRVEPARTMVEMFNDDEENDERLIDPFYGPLDGRDTNDQRVRCTVL